jgi:hypothetical protein
MATRRAGRFEASTAESAIGAILATLMLAAFGAVIGDLVSGTIKAALEGAGVALFAAGMIAAPVYSESIRRRHDV